LLFSFARSRRCSGQCGRFLALGKHCDDLPLANILSIVESQADHSICDRRGQSHLLIGDGGTDCFIDIGEVADLHRADRDERGRPVTLGLAFAAGGQCEQNQGDGDAKHGLAAIRVRAARTQAHHR
jgi:hypothetical protein